MAALLAEEAVLGAQRGEPIPGQCLGRPVDLGHGVHCARLEVGDLHTAASALPDGAPDENQKINPYAISLDPERWEADGLMGGEGMSVAEARQTPAQGMENLFMEAIATPA